MKRKTIKKFYIWKGTTICKISEIPIDYWKCLLYRPKLLRTSFEEKKEGSNDPVGCFISKQAHLAGNLYKKKIDVPKTNE